MDRPRNSQPASLRSGGGDRGDARSRLSYVLDASVVAAWYVPSQSTERALALIASARTEQWIVPHCFTYETPNLLLREERKGQIVPGVAEVVLAELSTVFLVQALGPPDDSVIQESLRFARAHRISLFDALYARCAFEADAVLASRDGGLLTAALALGCKVYDARDP